MEMNFSNVLRLILMFYSQALKHADTASEEAANLGNIYIEDGTLFVATGFIGDKILEGDMTNGVLTLGIGNREIDLDMSDSTLNISFI